MGPDDADEDLAFCPTTCLTSLSFGGGMMLNLEVGGVGRGTYPGVPSGTFLAGALYPVFLTCCSSCSLVVSSFPICFSSSSCLACLKGSFEEVGSFLFFPVPALTELCQSLPDLPPQCLQALFLCLSCFSSSSYGVVVSFSLLPFSPRGGSRLVLETSPNLPLHSWYRMSPKTG